MMLSSGGKTNSASTTLNGSVSAYLAPNILEWGNRSHCQSLEPAVHPYVCEGLACGPQGGGTYKTEVLCAVLRGVTVNELPVERLVSILLLRRGLCLRRRPA